MMTGFQEDTAILPGNGTSEDAANPLGLGLSKGTVPVERYKGKRRSPFSF